MSQVWRRRDQYALLEVDRGADDQQIRAAYRLQAKAWHPDSHPENQEAAGERFDAITRAYDVLSDPAKRREYDLRLPPDFDTDSTGEWPEPVQNLAEAWKQLAAHLKDEDLGTPFQRKMAYTAGDCLDRRRELTPKQRPFAEQAWALGVADGWEPAL